MTQKELVVSYVKEFGSILPAKIAGSTYKGYMFGSETSKRCRELRKDGVLQSHLEGKFEVFTMNIVRYAEEVFTPEGYVRVRGSLMKIVWMKQ